MRDECEENASGKTQAAGCFLRAPPVQAYPALHLRAFLCLTRAFLHPPEKRKKITPVPQAEMPLWKEPFFSALKETGEWMDFSQGDFEPQINFQIHSHFRSFHLQWNNETCSTS